MDPKSQLINTACVCGATEATVIGEKNGHQVGQCPCGVVRTLTRTPDYVEQYTDGDHYHVEQQLRDDHVPYTARFQNDYRLAHGSRIPKLLRRFRSLDVGCSNGAFVRAMADTGFEAVGLELNPQMATWARSQTACPIHTSWDQIRGYFDVITYHDVFEHVVDPTAELKRIRNNWLYTYGLLVIDVPDVDTATDIGWKHWRPEQHLWHWSEETLCTLLREQRFEVVHVERPIPGKLVVYARLELDL